MVLVSYTILLLCAAWLIGVSVFMLARPELSLNYLAKFASTYLINYTELGLRMIAGFAFVNFSDYSRYPQGFYVLGWFLVASAGILMLTPRRWHAKYAVYWSEKLPPILIRFAAPFSFLAALFLFFAIHK